MNKSKRIGTQAESIVLAVCRRQGFPYARRSVLSGSKDVGDLHLGDGTDTIIEVKGGKQCESLTPAKMDKWMSETRAEIRNSNSKFGFLVTQRKGFGEKSAEGWYAHIPVELCGGGWDNLETISYVTTDLETALNAVKGILNG